MKIKSTCGLLVLILFCLGCAPKLFDTKWTTAIAPESYTTRFETTKGAFEIEITRKHSPEAADRFYQLVKQRYFDDGIFYRVKPQYVAQFGSSDSLQRQQWAVHKLADEPVIQGNTKGALSFARGGKESRGTDLYINLKNNPHLDTLLYHNVKGFPSFGKVTKGMEVVASLYSGHADTTMASIDLLYKNRAKFMAQFPNLSVIENVVLIDNSTY